MLIIENTACFSFCLLKYYITFVVPGVRIYTVVVKHKSPSGKSDEKFKF